MDIAGIILAGGLGSRMGHVDKASLNVGGMTTLERLLAVYRPLFSEIIISVREAGGTFAEGMTIAPDLFETRSSLTGIHGGLAKCRSSHAFVAACDTPFLQVGLVERLLQQAEPDDDVVIPLKDDGYMEPLCAIYSTRCFGPITEQLHRDDFKIIRFFDQVQVKTVPVGLLEPGDPEHLSFMNANTPDDLARCRAIAKERNI